jgi:UDP-glucose 4-epimerase
MKSLVTGGCGFIGSHIVDQLIDLGHEVIVIDNMSSKSRDVYYHNDRAQYHKFDLKEKNDKIYDLYKNVDYVFHLASEVSIPYCVQNPYESMENNVLSTMNALEASRIHNVKRFIFSSTSAVYGNTLFLPSVESNPSMCLNTYSISKLSGEELCKMYYSLYGLKTIIFRYFNVYGERQPTQGQYAPVMGIFMRQKKNNEPLTIYGEGYQSRDFVHVKDVARANVIAAETKLYKYGEIFNVGSGSSISIEDIANLISKNQIHLPEREGEVLHSRADIRKINGILEWEPTIDVRDWIKRNAR